MGRWKSDADGVAACHWSAPDESTGFALIGYMDAEGVVLMDMDISTDGKMLNQWAIMRMMQPIDFRDKDEILPWRFTNRRELTADEYLSREQAKGALMQTSFACADLGFE